MPSSDTSTGNLKSIKSKVMKRIYNTGIDTNQIELDVKVGTQGTAYTSVNLARTGGENRKIAESNANSGDILKKDIGDAKTIRDAYLIIRTTIDFSSFPTELWPNLADTVVVKYHFNGGFSGDQIYNYDTDDIDIVLNGKVVVITKPIELK